MDPLEAGKFILMLGGMAGLYLKINQAARAAAGKGEAREITNNPLNTQNVPRVATMDDVNHVARRLTGLEMRIDAHISESRATTHDLQTSVTDLRDRMDDKLATMDETLREMSRSLGRLEGS